MLGAARCDLLLADDRVAGSGIAGIAAADAAGVVLDPVRGDRLEPVGRGRASACWPCSRLTGTITVCSVPAASLPVRSTLVPGVEVLLPVLLEVGDRCRR